MTAKEAISKIEGLKEEILTLQRLIGLEKAETPALDKSLEVLYKEAEIEESTAWFKEALESGYFKDSQYNSRHPEAEDDSSQESEDE